MKRTKQCCIGLGADIDWKKKGKKKKTRHIQAYSNKSSLDSLNFEELRIFICIVVFLLFFEGDNSRN
jgi:hypothetical protein